MEVFLLGAGYSARAWARMAAGDARFAGTTRSEEGAARLRALGIEPFLPEVAVFGDRLAGASHLLVSVPPDETGDGMATQIAQLRLPQLQWIGYLSTTGVYGDHGGAWIDEDSQCKPRTPHSRARLRAEQTWQQIGKARGIPAAILRLAGIYGPGRNAFVQIARGRAVRIVKPGHVFNRVHVADIARALDHLARPRRGGIFNLADDQPAPGHEVIRAAAEMMGAPLPPEIAYDPEQVSPMQRAFYGECKRVSNARIRQTGFDLLFPDYRAGLQQLLDSGSWRGE